MGKQIEMLPNDTMRVLRNWNWPGNIREFEKRFNIALEDYRSGTGTFRFA